MTTQHVHINTNLVSTRKNNTLFMHCLTALAIGSGMASSYAQESTHSTSVLEEIVVTASRREESLQQTASSIAVVTGADLERQGITDFKSLGQAMSGITIDQPASGLSSAVYIRGVGTAGINAALKSVGIMVDGVYQTLPGMAFTELMDINRIEVLRGPQGTLFGKNTTAGVIRVFTADPVADEFSGWVQGALGDYDQGEIRGLVNIPLIEDTLAMRLSGYSAERDGFVKNAFLDTDARNEDREGWRAKFLLNATEDLTFKFMAQHDERDSRMTSGLSEYGPAFLQVYGPTVANFPISPTNSQENHASYVKDDIDSYQFNLDWSFANHSLSTISALTKYEMTLDQDQDNTILSGHAFNGGLSQLFSLVNREVLTHEIQLTSDFDNSAWSYVLGYFYQEDDSNTIVQFFIPGFGLIDRPTTDTVTDSQAVFGNVSYDFNDRWNASLGVRYTEDERAGDNGFVSPDGGAAIETFDETTYALKLRYQLNNDIMLYASHDKGFKSGGVQSEFVGCTAGGRCVDETNALWDSEVSYNYELGMKGEFLDNSLRLNAAVFFQTYDDFQVVINYPGENANAVANAAEVESKGIELEGQAVIGNNIVMNASITYAQTEYTDYRNAPCATSFTPGCVNNVQDLTGETLDHAPELTFNLGSEYRTNLGFADLFARLDLIYKGDQELSSTQSPFTDEDAYALINGRIGLERSDDWKLTLWVSNLTDEDYLTGASYGLTGLYQTPGQPRMYGVLVDYMF